MKIALTLNLDDSETLAVLHRVDPGRTMGRRDRNEAVRTDLQQLVHANLDGWIKAYYTQRRAELAKQIDALDAEINDGITSD